MATGAIGTNHTAAKKLGNFDKGEQDYLPIELPYKNEKDDQEMEVEPNLMSKNNSIMKL